MKTHTETQLQQALAKMLPEKLKFDKGLSNKLDIHLRWMYDSDIPRQEDIDLAVLPTELLHLCWLVEETLDSGNWINYIADLYKVIYPNKTETNSHEIWRYLTHATWQQRVTALAKVKGVEIV